MNKLAAAETIAANLEPAVELLEKLIAFPSLRGQEGEIGRFLKSRLEPAADSIEMIGIPNAIQNDPDYAFPLENFSYAGTANLRAKLGGASRGKTIAFNTHLDVVPPSPGQREPFLPRRHEGKIYGRGACDAKGQIATLWLVLKTLRDLAVRPVGDITVDFVVEEECGGNGTLQVVRNGLSADAAVVLEPTNLQVAHLVRGAVWFEILAAGKAGHSGSPDSTENALKIAVEAMGVVERVREELLEVSRREIPKIARHPNPMPCTFGVIHSGNWPSAAPSEAVLKGVFGFLPPFKREDIQDKLAEALRPLSAEIKFSMLRSNPSSLPDDHPLVQILIGAAHEAGIPARAEFMNASCDSWRYPEELRIPAVVFGPGSIASAHSPDEHIAVEDIRKAALALIYFIHDWSGLDHA